MHEPELLHRNVISQIKVIKESITLFKNL